MTPEHMKTTPEDIDLDRMKDDTISRQAVLKLLSTIPAEEAITKAMIIQSVKQMDAAQPSGPDNLVKDSQGLAKDLVNDCISRKAAIDAVMRNACNTQRIYEAIKGLPSAQPEQRWIPCSERLPDRFGKMLVTFIPGTLWTYVIIANYSDLMGIAKPCFWIGNVGKNDFANITSQVVAWMSLPEPYNEDDK